MCYWNTNKVKERKFKKHYEREQGKQAKQCNLTNQVKKTKQKEEKYKNNNKIGSTGPIVAYYWKTSEVKARKLKIHYEKENKGNQSNNSI